MSEANIASVSGSHAVVIRLNGLEGFGTERGGNLRPFNPSATDTTASGLIVEHPNRISNRFTRVAAVDFGTVALDSEGSLYTFGQKFPTTFPSGGEAWKGGTKWANPLPAGSGKAVRMWVDKTTTTPKGGIMLMDDTGELFTLGSTGGYTPPASGSSLFSAFKPGDKFSEVARSSTMFLGRVKSTGEFWAAWSGVSGTTSMTAAGANTAPPVGALYLTTLAKTRPEGTMCVASWRDSSVCYNSKISRSRGFDQYSPEPTATNIVGIFESSRGGLEYNTSRPTYNVARFIVSRQGGEFENSATTVTFDGNMGWSAANGDVYSLGTGDTVAPRGRAIAGKAVSASSSQVDVSRFVYVEHDTSEIKPRNIYSRTVAVDAFNRIWFAGDLGNFGGNSSTFTKVTGMSEHTGYLLRRFFIDGHKVDAEDIGYGNYSGLMSYQDGCAIAIVNAHPSRYGTYRDSTMTQGWNYNYGGGRGGQGLSKYLTKPLTYGVSTAQPIKQGEMVEVFPDDSASEIQFKGIPANSKAFIGFQSIKDEITGEEISPEKIELREISASGNPSAVVGSKSISVDLFPTRTVTISVRHPKYVSKSVSVSRTYEAYAFSVSPVVLTPVVATIKVRAFSGDDEITDTTGLTFRAVHSDGYTVEGSGPLLTVNQLGTYSVTVVDSSASVLFPASSAETVTISTNGAEGSADVSGLKISNAIQFTSVMVGASQLNDFSAFAFEAKSDATGEVFTSSGSLFLDVPRRYGFTVKVTAVPEGYKIPAKTFRAQFNETRETVDLGTLYLEKKENPDDGADSPEDILLILRNQPKGVRK